MSDCPSCSELEAELASVQAALDLEVSRRCLGGKPPAVDPNWGNVTTAPPSASDDRMPSHRRLGMARSDDGVKQANG